MNAQDKLIFYGRERENQEDAMACGCPSRHNLLLPRVDYNRERLGFGAQSPLAEALGNP